MPCMTLSVASVAMIDGSRTFRIRKALTQADDEADRDAARSKPSANDHHEPPVVRRPFDATTTMSVINAPTDTSKPPTIRAFTCPIATRASGSAPLEPSRLLRLNAE